MRSQREVDEVLHLRAEGLGARRISKATGIPLTTVQHWLRGSRLGLRGRKRASRNCEHWCELRDSVDERAYAYLLGMYLGDGHIVRYPRSFLFSIYCDDKYPRIMAEVESAIRRVLPGATVRTTRREGCSAISAYSAHWPCFFPQHGPGRKHERPIRLEAWQQEIVDRHPRPLLRGLIHSDGCRVLNVAVRTTELAIERRYYTRYHFSNASTDIQRIFTDTCDRLGIHWTQPRARDIAVSRRADVHYLDSFVGPKR